MITLTPFQRRPWSILDELESLQEDMNKAFGEWTPSRSYSSTNTRRYPPLNVWHSQDAITVDAELPGVDPQDVDIAVEGDQLTIRGEINVSAPEDAETYYRRERPAGEFARTLQLPFRADAGNVKANYKNGILRITVPRSEEDKPRKVTIDVE